MKYVWKEIVVFFEKEKWLLVGIIVCILLSTILIHASLGILNDYQNRVRSENPELRNVKITFSNQKEVIKEKLEACLFSLSNDVKKSLESILVYSQIDGMVFENRFLLEDHTYKICEVFRDNLQSANLTTGYYSTRQEEEGALVALAYCNNFQHLPNKKSLMIQKKDYQIVGYQKWSETPIVPFASLENTTKIDGEKGVSFSFSKAVTLKQYRNLEQCFRTEIGEQIQISQVDFGQNWDIFHHLELLIPLFFIIIAALNFAMLYKYILLKRRRFFAIYRLVGMEWKKIIFHYIKECLIFLILCYGIGTVVFHFLFLPQMKQVLDYMEDIYSGQAYMILFFFYIGVSIWILMFHIVIDIKGWNILLTLKRNR